MGLPTVGYCYDPIFLEHTLPGHPENAERLRAVMTLLREREVLSTLTALAFNPANFDELTAVHSPTYVSQVYRISEAGRGALNPDTYLTKQSFAAASMAVGASMTATDAVVKGQVQRAFALSRPPGHHAFADHGEGFCLFNNIAFAAKVALGDFAEHDMGWSPSASRAHRNSKPERVMIVDFDVHHGNGTQAFFYDDPRVLYVSVHEYGWSLYPGTGGAEEKGRGQGQGATLNVPLPPGVGDFGYARVFDEIIVPTARQFQPNLLLVSAGYDAHWRDPLAHMQVSLAGFARMMRVLCELSDELCAGKLVAVLEGGYDLHALSFGVMNTLRIMQNRMGDVEDPLGPCHDEETDIGALVTALTQPLK
jgi:acetoin utilization deacetylase AcuC-like enzyme